MTDLEYQIRRFHSFLWAGGGCFSDFNIHIIDHLCWMKNAWPVKAIGRRRAALQARPTTARRTSTRTSTPTAIEYTFADGAKMLFDGRTMDGTPAGLPQLRPRHQGLRHRLRRAATAARPSSIYKGQDRPPTNKLWQSTDRSNPYQNEWNDLMDAIVNDKPYNEVKRGVEASLVTSMGRMAAHTGPGDHVRRRCSTPTTSSRPDIDKLTTGLARPAAARRQGHVPAAGAGEEEAGVLKTVLPAVARASARVSSMKKRGRDARATAGGVFITPARGSVACTVSHTSWSCSSSGGFGADQRGDQDVRPVAQDPDLRDRPLGRGEGGHAVAAHVAVLGYGLRRLDAFALPPGVGGEAESNPRRPSLRPRPPRAASRPGTPFPRSSLSERDGIAGLHFGVLEPVGQLRFPAADRRAFSWPRGTLRLK